MFFDNLVHARSIADANCAGDKNARKHMRDMTEKLHVSNCLEDKTKKLWSCLN